MASMNELQDALMNADKAGDTAAARQLADAIHAMRSTEAAKPASVQAGGALNSLGRQAGLTARYGLEGLANTAQIATEPIRYLTDRLTGSTGKTKPLGALASSFADTLGLPSPQGADERVVGDATRLMAGAGGSLGVANVAQKLPGMAGQVFGALAANPAQQISSAAGAGLAGGASREAGGSAMGQALASLAGGVAAGMAPAAVNSVRNLMAP